MSPKTKYGLAGGIVSVTTGIVLGILYARGMIGGKERGGSGGEDTGSSASGKTAAGGENSRAVPDDLSWQEALATDTMAPMSPETSGLVGRWKGISRSEQVTVLMELRTDGTTRWEVERPGPDLIQLGRWKSFTSTSRSHLFRVNFVFDRIVQSPERQSGAPQPLAKLPKSLELTFGGTFVSPTLIRLMLDGDDGSDALFQRVQTGNARKSTDTGFGDSAQP